MCVCSSCLLNYLFSESACLLCLEIKQKQTEKHPCKEIKQTKLSMFFVPQVLRPGSRYEVSVSGVRKGNESGSISTEFTTGEV